MWHVVSCPGTRVVQGWHVECRTYTRGTQMTRKVLNWHVVCRYFTWWKHVKCRYLTCFDTSGSGNSRGVTRVLQVLHVGYKYATREVLPKNCTISFGTWVWNTSLVMKWWQTILTCYWWNHIFVIPFKKCWIQVVTCQPYLGQPPFRKWTETQEVRSDKRKPTQIDRQTDSHWQ